MEAETIRKRVIYHGRVQGVGFRATVYEIASNLPVSGFVRNLSDGTVEIIVDGSTDVVKSLMATIDRRFPSHISRTDEATVSRGEEFAGFQIRR